MVCNSHFISKYPDFVREKQRENRRHFHTHSVRVHGLDAFFCLFLVEMPLFDVCFAQYSSEIKIKT